MKKNRIALLLAICMVSTLTFAQYEGQRHHHQMPSVDAQLSRLSKNLNLSDSQQAQARTILQDQQDQMNALRQDSSMSREDRRSKMMEIHRTTSGKIRGLLNDDQLRKYDAMEQERRQHWQGHGGGGDGTQDNH